MSGGAGFEVPGVSAVTKYAGGDQARDDYNRSAAIYLMTSYFNTKDVAGYLAEAVASVVSGGLTFPTNYYKTVDFSETGGGNGGKEIQIDNNNFTVRIYTVTTSFLVPLLQDFSLCTAIRHIAEDYNNKGNGTTLKNAANKALQLLLQELTAEINTGLDAH